MNPDENPFWGEPIPTDVWDDMQKLDHLYEELMWDHRDKLEFAIKGFISCSNLTMILMIIILIFSKMIL